MLDLQGAASPNEVEETLPDRNAEEMAKEGFYLVTRLLRHCYCQGSLPYPLGRVWRG